jgi:hypothetical protein
VSGPRNVSHPILTVLFSRNRSCLSFFLGVKGDPLDNFAGALHRGALSSEKGSAENDLKAFASKLRPESGRDCLMCANFFDSGGSNPWSRPFFSYRQVDFWSVQPPVVSGPRNFSRRALVPGLAYVSRIHLNYVYPTVW